MTETQRRLLAGKARLSGLWQIAVEQFQFAFLATHFERVLQLELAVEMILDDALVAAGHENEELNACRARLVHHVLDHRAIDHGQHFLGHGLGGWQKPRAEASHREDGLADFAGRSLGGRTDHGGVLWLSRRGRSVSAKD